MAWRQGSQDAYVQTIICLIGQTNQGHKPAPITVEVNEPVGGTWRMVRSSHQWTKTAAWATQFTVPVAADGTAVLKYRVRVTY